MSWDAHQTYTPTRTCVRCTRRFQEEEPTRLCPRCERDYEASLPVCAICSEPIREDETQGADDFGQRVHADCLREVEIEAANTRRSDEFDYQHAMGAHR